jgi:hypothetical protein
MRSRMMVPKRCTSAAIVLSSILLSSAQTAQRCHVTGFFTDMHYIEEAGDVWGRRSGLSMHETSTGQRSSWPKERLNRRLLCPFGSLANTLAVAFLIVLLAVIALLRFTEGLLSFGARLSRPRTAFGMRCKSFEHPRAAGKRWPPTSLKSERTLRVRTKEADNSTGDEATPPSERGN